MQESDTYQAIIEEGQLKQAKKWLLKQGEKRFGPPDEAAHATLNALSDLDRLDSLFERLQDVSSWQELFAVP